MAQSSIASTVHKLWFAFLPQTIEAPFFGTYFIDVAQCLSVVNRRTYRQGMNYAVANMSFKYAPIAPAIPATFTSIEISKIPTTWVADNATTKAFETWKKQRAEVLEDQPSLKAKWADFKLFMDSDHVHVGTAGNLKPLSQIVDSCGGTNIEYLPGEWQHSEVVVPVPGADQLVEGTAQEVSLHVVGNHIPAADFDGLTTSVGLIKAYAASRARVLAPDPVPQGQYLSGFYNRDSLPDEMSQDVMSNVANRNDEPPYDLDDYPGGDLQAPFAQLVKKVYPSNFGSTTNTASVSTADSGSFVCPFGLVRIDTCGFSSATDYVIVEMDIVPGSYKGVLAEKGV